MAWGKWVDLELDDEEKVDMAMPAIAEAPQYPWGLRISLCGRELEKLGLPLPKVGEMIDLRAMATVCCVSDDGNNQRVELQIEKMKVENEDDDDEDDDDDE